MTEPVKLYVYDLSNGIARQMSRQLTGKQIDGIWHTSIVVYGREIFYGQGVSESAPGKSHHGQPLEIVHIGETAIDQDTFNEYLSEMTEHYTVDKYHLLDFNCNSFTNDLASFLTGGSIPDHIKDLPTEFLNTPFGAALRPTIDNMYRRPTPGEPQISAAQPNAPLNPAMASSILQSVASMAQGPQQSGSQPLAATQSLTGALHTCNNSASFQALLRNNRAVVANFGNLDTCPPCRMIAPVFEDLAHEKAPKTAGGPGAAFTEIDMRTSHGSALASEWGIRVMPTFLFFLDGKKVAEMKGANANELRSQVDLLLFQAFPPHPHTSLSLPAMRALALKPILFTQVPALDTVLAKLSSFIDSATWFSGASKSQEHVKQTLSSTIFPYLKSRFSPADPSKPLPTATPKMLVSWAELTTILSNALPLASLFPVVDLWRLALLDPSVGTWIATVIASPANPVSTLIRKLPPNVQDTPRPLLLTFLRLLSNAYATEALARYLVSGPLRDTMTSVLVPSLLHDDASVRTSAASLAFNATSLLQKSRVEKVQNIGNSSVAEDEDWQVEMLSAVIEALDREKTPEVVYRLAASLSCLIRLSPFYESQLQSLLEVLQAQKILKSKIELVDKKDVRALIVEVADKLCA